MDEPAPASPRAIYVIDTSALVDLRLEYPLKTFGRLWQRFEDLAHEGRLVAPEEVRHELGHRDDELKAWALRADGLFRTTDDGLIACLARVMATCSVHGGRQYDADPWIVALAIQLCEAESRTLFPRPVLIVTHETPAKAGCQPKIPDIATGYDVRCIRLRDVFALEAWEGH
jgi:hypothetical protein